MNIHTFEDLLDRHGADVSRWPSDLRGDGAALLAHSAEARDLRAAMASVEDVLRASSLGASSLGASSLDPAPSDTTRTAAPPFFFAATAMRRPQARRVSPLVRNAKWSAAVAAALVLGVLVGTLQFDAAEISPDQVVTSALESPGSVDVD